METKELSELVKEHEESIQQMAITSKEKKIFEKFIPLDKYACVSSCNPSCSSCNSCHTCSTCSTCHGACGGGGEGPKYSTMITYGTTKNNN